MTTKSGRAAALLRGAPELLALGLLADIEALDAAEKPRTDSEIERRMRARGVAARTGQAIVRFEQQLEGPDGPRDEDEMNAQDADDAEDPEVLERKCAELRALLDRYGERMDRRAAASAAARSEGDDRDQLAGACERRAA